MDRVRSGPLRHEVGEDLPDQRDELEAVPGEPSGDGDLRVFGVQRRVVRALRPVLSRAAGVPMPEDSVFEAIERLHADLEQVQQILTEKDATVRLVLTPEAVVVAEARRSLTTLSLYGYRVDGVIANRVFPEGDGDEWRQGWVRAQQAVLAEVRQSFVDLLPGDAERGSDKDIVPAYKSVHP